MSSNISQNKSKISFLKVENLQKFLSSFIFIERAVFIYLQQISFLGAKKKLYEVHFSKKMFVYIFVTHILNELRAHGEGLINDKLEFF